MAAAAPPPLPTRPATRRGRALAGAALGIGGALVLYHSDPYAGDSWLPSCPVRALTGLYCPACGATRCLHSLLHLDLAPAWAANPLLLLLLPVLGLLALRLLGLRPASIEPVMRRVASPWPWLAILAVYGVLRNLPWATSVGLVPV